MVLLLALWSKIRGWVLGLGVILTLLSGVYLKGRMDQRSNQKAQQAKQEAKDLKTRQEIDNEVNHMSTSDLDSELNKWMRD